MSGVIYAGLAASGRLLLSRDERVTEINAHWPSLGRSGAAALRPATVGARFVDLPLGGAAAALYEALFEHARRRFLVSLDVRVAEHTRRRRLELRILPCAQGELELTLRLVSEQATAPVSLFDPDAVRSPETIAVCGFCHRVHGFTWGEPETALRQLRIDAAEPQPRLAPAVCDDCERRIAAASGLRLTG